MSEQLLEKTRKLNRLLQRSGSDPVIFNDICKVLNEIMGTNILIVSKKAKLLGSLVAEGSGDLFKEEDIPIGNFIDLQLNEQLMNIVETKENVSASNFHFKNLSKTELKNYSVTVIPIGAGGERLGTLFLYKYKNDYTVEDIILVEYGATVVGLEILRSKSEENAEEIRKSTIVKSAIGTLSYSELEAILHIFEELNGMEGLLVASKIADRVGITRSVIVNALRKFESAGVIESRSLGMKGTYIKVLNEVLIEELNKLRK